VSRSVVALLGIAGKGKAKHIESASSKIESVLAVSNVLTAPIFSNSRNFETEGDTPEKHRIKSLDP